MNSLETRLRREEELDKIKEALDQGTISKQEYEAILAHDYGIHEEQTARWPIVAAALVILGVFGLFAMWGGTITGLVVYPTETTLTGGVYENNTIIALNTTNTTTIQLSGMLENGSATVFAQSNNETYLVWSGTTNNNTIWLEKKQYTMNETIMLETELTNYSLWVIDANDNRTPVQNNFTMSPGDYTLEVLANEKHTIDFSVGEESIERIGRVEFVEACEETCELNGLNNVSLAITLSKGAKLELTEIIVTTPSENTPPQQIAEIPTVTVNGTATIDLSAYFKDTDELTYEINNIIGIEETIQGSNLTLTSNSPGEYTATLYVSDLKAVTTANFDIVVLGETEEANETINETNQTINETMTNETNTTNDTTETTTEQTNETCDHPNPNKRPLECIQEEQPNYRNEPVFLEDNNRRILARITPIGNMQIRGGVVENTQQQAPVGAWIVYNYDQYGTARPVAWIEAGSGDLHLTGELYEEQLQLLVPQGAYSIQNRQGINLAYIDRETGDMHVRGNIITGREVKQ